MIRNNVYHQHLVSGRHISKPHVFFRRALWRLPLPLKGRQLSIQRYAML